MIRVKTGIFFNNFSKTINLCIGQRSLFENLITTSHFFWSWKWYRECWNCHFGDLKWSHFLNYHVCSQFEDYYVIYGKFLITQWRFFNNHDSLWPHLTPLKVQLCHFWRNTNFWKKNFYMHGKLFIHFNELIEP